MEKKYQVFISSTYEDLRDERQAVINCLLNMNCIPVGMEQFPSSPLSQWDYITKMIDMSDYLILIIAGRYGSIDPDSNIGYTEKEYEYAKMKGIPVLSFLHEDISQLRLEKCGKTDDERELVNKFRERVRGDKKLVTFYSDANNLQNKVAVAIQAAIKDVPRAGWVKADEVEQQMVALEDRSWVNDIQCRLEDIKKTVIEHIDQTRIEWKEISVEDIEKMFDEPKKEIVVPTLSTEEKILLKEAAMDRAGQILVISDLSGTAIQTNGKTLNQDLMGKSLAIWKDALYMLIDKKMVDEVGSKHEIFQLTKTGYDVAEQLEA